jgi:hypothetical protein
MIARVVRSLYNRTKMTANDLERTKFLGDIADILQPLGYTLHEEQPHISGERAHMSRTKMVLMGADPEGKTVVIKASKHPSGIKEIRQEKVARDVLTHLSFAVDELLQAEELFFEERSGFLFFVTAYIPQDEIFVTRPIEEQFFLALRAFEAQETFHATTYAHGKEIKKHFAVYTPATYIATFKSFIEEIEAGHKDSELSSYLTRAHELLVSGAVVLERYGNFLTHTDFVPHNMRVHKRAIYALDLTSVHFGNKYEGWARFLNYMVAHNPPLERALVDYIKINRPEEYFNLRLMRLYKLGFLLSYYVRLLPNTVGNHREITLLRIKLWTRVLGALLDDEPISDSVIETYTSTRNNLRTEEEKARQRDFAVT